MLVRAGLLAEGQARAAAERASEQHVSHVEALLELGLLDEDALVTFLHSKLTIPRVSPQVLRRVVERAPPVALPAVVAWQFAALPVARDDLGNTTVALADPTDLIAVDAVQRCLGAGYLVRAVAPTTALRAAIRQVFGDVPQALRDPRGDAATLPGPAVHGAPQQVVRDDVVAAVSTANRAPAPAASPAPAATQAFAAAATQLPEPGPATAWNPPLQSERSAPEPLSPEAFAAVVPRVVHAKDRDDITEVLLDFLGAGFRRVLLFTHLQGELRGRDCRGDDLVVEAVRQVRIPAGGDSVFSRVIASRAPYFGRLDERDPINAAFAQALGGVRGNVLVLPVILATKVPVVVFAAGSSRPLDPRSLQALTEAVAQSLERIILTRKFTPHA